MNPETSVPSASTCSVAPVVNSSDAAVGTTAPMAMASVPQSVPALSCTSSSHGIISTPITSTSTSPSNHTMLQLPPPPTPAPAPAVVAPQASVHQSMLHPPFSNVTQTSLPQVQVIQQPIHGSTYLQHLYTSQQQMLLPGNLTVQPTGVAQTLQSLGTAPGVNLQLQNKSGVDPKSVGVVSTIIPASSVQSISTTGKGIALSSPNMMTAAGQVIATGGKTCVPGQMISTAKSTAVLQGQTGFVPSTTGSQTVVIGQFGMLSNQASIVPSHNKTVNENQKGKSFMMGQPAALQPKSSPILPCPVSSANATQVLTNTHLKHLTTSPQLITGQAPTAMIASQAQILGSLQALGASLPQGITWAAHGGLQSPTLFTQNPILIRSQQPDMFIQSPSPAFHAVPMASTAPSSHMAVIPTTPYMQKQKQVRPASSVATQTAVSTAAAVQSRAPPARTQAKQRARGQNSRGSPGGSQPHPPHPQTSTIQTQTPPLQHQKADAANQTKPTPEMKSTATQSKSVSTETGHQNFVKQSVQPLPAMAVLPKQIYQSSNVEAKVSSDVQVASSNGLQKDETVEMDQESVVENNGQLSNNDTAVESGQLETPKKEEEALNAPPPDVVSKEKQPQKAIVKPHILTHVIDGYVILEGPEPFPVSRSSLLTDCTNLKPDPVEKPPEGDTRPITRVTTEEKVQKTSKNRGPAELSKCELCGKLGAKSKLKRSKRFCSTSCCKRYNVGCSERLGIFPPANQQTSVAGNKVVKKKKMGFKTRKGWRKSQGGRLAYNVSEWQNQNTSPQTDQGTPIEIESEESVKGEGEGETTDTPSGPESSMSPTTPSSHKEEMEVDCPEPPPIVSSSPLKWTVQEVVDFIHGLPGCTDYADEFRSQEIDGQALLLLKEDHLMTAMNMKLGPALKICACIKSLKQGIDGKCQQ